VIERAENMPELPDVEAVIKRIKRRMSGRYIRKISILDKSLVTGTALKPILGKKIVHIWRRGKYLLFSLDNNHTLVIHLRMTGNLVMARAKDEIDVHTRLILHLDDERDVRFIDQRRLGKLYIIYNMNFQNIPGLKQMGPEPLSKDFMLREFIDRLHERTGGIKSLIMNQRFIAGIGNIYGDEILFQSRIKPLRKASHLTREQVQRLYFTMRKVLSKACERNADLSAMHNWFVHGRDKGYCVHCKGALKRVKIQGRYSYYCTKCQR
jgi:formamidopyrimidine-DNA glycosylase